MTIEVFHEARDLLGYRAWVTAHKDGYVLARKWHNGEFQGKFHRVSCRWIQSYISPATDDPLSDHRYKACSTNLAELKSWGEYAHQSTPHTPPVCCECIHAVGAAVAPDAAEI
jgi:hypothetical protein